MSETVHTIVIGGGQAGLAVSYYLKSRSIEHVLLERGGLGETWRTQRWDSFVLNTPNSVSNLPGMPLHPERPSAFENTTTLRSYFGAYAAKYGLPIRTQVNVRMVTVNERGFAVEAHAGTWQARSVVVATGGQNVAKEPAMATRLANGMLSTHTNAYRNPAQLPPGAVLIVGSAQSGCQIAEELLEAKRTVYLSTSKVGRTRRRYRGKDILEWVRGLGMFAQRTRELAAPEEQFAPPPVATGAGGGHTLSLQGLRRQGCRLLGRLRDVDGYLAHFENDLPEHVHYADAFSQRMLQRIDRFIVMGRISAPPREEDSADEPVSMAEGWAEEGRLDLRAEGITSVIWATGFRGEFDYLQVPGALDERGQPLHNEGASGVTGLFYVGLPWLRARSSGVIYGADPDGTAIAECCVALYRDPSGRS